jgi:hypothetical protein
MTSLATSQRLHAIALAMRSRVAANGLNNNANNNTRIDGWAGV